MPATARTDAFAATSIRAAAPPSVSSATVPAWTSSDAAPGPSPRTYRTPPPVFTSAAGLDGVTTRAVPSGTSRPPADAPPPSAAPSAAPSWQATTGRSSKAQASHRTPGPRRPPHPCETSSDAAATAHPPRSRHAAPSAHTRATSRASAALDRSRTVRFNVRVPVNADICFRPTCCPSPVPPYSVRCAFAPRTGPSTERLHAGWPALSTDEIRADALSAIVTPCVSGRDTSLSAVLE